MGVLLGCSTEKNTRVSRTYHNITSHYNIFFNGNESMKAGVQRIDRSISDDYTRLLPIFKSSEASTARTATSEMEYAIGKASKLIKIHSITKNPKRRKRRTEAYKKLAAKEEYNKWVDDAYLLMGKSYFYMHNFNSAIENFSYVIRKFSEEEIKYDAYLWLVRSYTMLERYVEALEIIQVLEGDEDFPKNLVGELALVTADFHIQQLQYEDAIPFVSIAVKHINSKTRKARYKFILAQLYEETGNGVKASEVYREVARMNPPYKMAFNARINAAEAFTGEGDVEKLKKELRKMLRDRKNTEFKDQIYYALGNIYQSEGEKDVAKDLYIKSAASSLQNMHQRALSCLTLADLYFDEPEYLKSQAYYDSAMVVIDENYPDYDVISDRHKDLSRLVDNIYTVQKEDSLQRIAQMSEAEREAMIDEWIRNAKIEEQRKKEEEQNRMMDRSYNRMNQGLGLGRQQESAGWYFYSPTTVAYGRVEFQQIWGNRKLEDGWRRSTKMSRSEIEAEEIAEEQKTDTIDNVIRVIDPKERDFYLQDLPLNDSLMTLSHERIRDALYNAGRIFKTVFSNYERAIDSYLELNERYSSSIYEMSSYFELWDLYKRIGDLAKAEEYKNKLIAKYPESNYAKYLINPNYFIELEARNDSLNSLYRQAFYHFKQGAYQNASSLTEQILTMEPDSTLLPKIEFIRTVSMAPREDWAVFSRKLSEYVQRFPDKEPTPLVEEILALIQDSTLADYQQLIESGYLSEQIQNEELLVNENSEDEFGGKFSYDEELLHYFVIAFPRDVEVDINRLKFDIANYNIDHYTKIDFDIETENLGSNTKLVLVRALSDKESSLIYFRSIIRKREVFQSLAGVKYVNFVVSSLNYREILSDKNYTEYLKFFVKNYSRFITGDFKEGMLPDPEELMAKAQEEENNLEERGTFVMVTPGRSSRLFNIDTDANQNFVIAVNDKSFSMRKLLTDISGFNRKMYKDKNLKISQEQAGDYKMIVVRSLGVRQDALKYFTSVVTARELFESLGMMSYRNFLISDENLQKLIETGNVANYMKFFSEVYLKRLSGAADSEPESEKNVQPQRPVNSSESKPVETKPIEEKEETKPEIPAAPKYSGPFNADISGTHCFALLIPNSGVNKPSLLSAIKSFNTKNYTSALTVEELPFDNARTLIVVKGIAGKQEALNYLMSIIKETSIYDPLSELDYRNFIATEANVDIIQKNKDIKAYIDFFRTFYLNK